MIFPENWDDLCSRVMWLIERCKETQRERTHVYDRRERYFLFGAAGSQPVRYNRIESHLDLVSSFLYSPDHAFYQIAAQANANEQIVRQVVALQDEMNEDFVSCGMNDMLMDGIQWSLVYGAMHVKQGWNEVAKEGFGTLVPPFQFGVFREDITDLDSQEAFVHTYPIEYYDAVQRMVRAGRSADVDRIATVQEARPMPYPDMMTRLIIAGTGGTNLAGNMIGSVNPDYTPTDNYQSKTQHPMVLFDELWVWDSTTNDYRVFHVIEPDIVIGDSKRTIKAMLGVPKLKKQLQEKAQRVRRRRRRAGDGLVAILDTDAPGDDDFTLSESNPFLPGEHPFTRIAPYRKYNFYWGKAHIDALTGLQDWLNERFEQIDDILDRQAYPPRVGTGMAGISDEKFAAFGEADSYILEQMPNAKVEELHPQMPPDLFAEVNEIGKFFLEASGLTDIIMGQGAEGVRSKTHAQQQARFGSGRIKKAALSLEPSLTRIGDIGLKLKMKNDDEPIVPQEAPQFLPAQVATKMRIKVSAHAHSPLFVDDAREMAAVLIKAGAIDKEMLVRMLHPPNRDAILHGLQMQQRQQAQMMQSLPPEDRIKVLTGGKAGGQRGRR